LGFLAEGGVGNESGSSSEGKPSLGLRVESGVSGDEEKRERRRRDRGKRREENESGCEEREATTEEGRETKRSTHILLESSRLTFNSSLRKSMSPLLGLGLLGAHSRSRRQSRSRRDGLDGNDGDEFFQFVDIEGILGVSKFLEVAGREERGEGVGEGEVG